MDARHTGRILRSAAAGSLLLLNLNWTAAGDHLLRREPRDPHMSPACQPAWGYHPTCWQRFPPVPPCDPVGTCDCQFEGTVPSYGTLPLYAPQTNPAQPNFAQPQSVLPQHILPQSAQPGAADSGLTVPPVMSPAPTAPTEFVQPMPRPALSQPVRPVQPVPPLPPLPGQLESQPAPPNSPTPAGPPQSRYGTPAWLQPASSSRLVVPEQRAVLPLPSVQASTGSRTDGSVLSTQAGLVIPGSAAAITVAQPVSSRYGSRPQNTPVIRSIPFSRSEPVSGPESAAATTPRWSTASSQLVLPDTRLVGTETAEPLIYPVAQTRPLKPTP